MTLFSIVVNILIHPRLTEFKGCLLHWPGYILAALVQIFPFMSVYPKVVESLYHPESLELIEFLWKHHDTPKLNQSAGIHVGVLGQLRSVEVSDNFWCSTGNPKRDLQKV